MRRGGTAWPRLTALGVSSGQACWTVAASAGLAALLVASEPAFVALKLAGRRTSSSSARTRSTPRSVGGQVLLRASPGGCWRRDGLRQGLISNLGNPKMAVFFTSLLPQFMATARRRSSRCSRSACLFAMTFVGLSAYAAAVAKAEGVLRRLAVRRALDAATGAVLIAFGCAWQPSAAREARAVTSFTRARPSRAVIQTR